MKTKRSSFWTRSYVSWIVYGLLTFLVLLLQMAPRLFPMVYYARPTPLVLLVVCVALFEGPRIGAGIGLLAGLLWDVYAFRLFGFDALTLMVLGLVVGLLVQWLMRANFFACMLLCMGGVLLHGLLEWVFCHLIFQEEEALRLVTAVYLPNCAYTLLFAPLMFWVTLGLARLLRRRNNAQ